MNEKGFTLVELVVALAISSLIFVALGSFLVFNLRSYNATTDIIDLQYEGQLVMNQLSALAKESKGVERLDDSDGLDRLDDGGAVAPALFELSHYEYNDITTTDEKTTYSISFIPPTGTTSGKVRCLVTAHDGSLIDDYLMADYVESFTLTPEEGKDFETGRSMVISMEFVNGKYDFSLTSEVKFRNKH